MSDNSALLPPVITCVYAGVVLAAFLLLPQAINFTTECLGHDISMAGNGRPTAGPHGDGASPIHRHAFGEDTDHNFASDYLESCFFLARNLEQLTGALSSSLCRNATARWHHCKQIFLC
jgi:hypothetical protein